MRSVSSSSSQRIGIALGAVLLATALLYVLRFGYDYGVSDQDEFLPYLFNLMDASVLGADWLVGLQSGGFSVRTGFVHVLHALVLIGASPEWAVGLVYVASFSAIGIGLFRIAKSVSNTTTGALVSIPAVLLVTARWNPGGNDVLYGMLVPEIPAWGLVLWGAFLLLSTHPRPVFSAILVGVAVWMQALVGLLSGVLVIVTLMAGWASGEVPGRRVLVWSIAWAVFALPVIWMLAPGASPVAAEATHILVTLRAPHHYLPQMFTASSVILLIMLTALAAWVLWSVPQAFNKAADRQLLAFLCWILVLVLCVGAVLVHMWPAGPWTVLQPFKLAVLLRVLTAIIICIGVFSLPPLSRIPIRYVTIGSIGVLLLGTALTGTVSPLQQRAFPFLTPERAAFEELTTEIRENTDNRAIVIIPPAWTGFQTASKRAQYVNFKAFPFEPEAVLEWYRRMTLIGTSPDGLRGTEWLQTAQTAYENRSPGEWEALFERTDASHAVLGEGHSPVPELFCAHGWCLVETNPIIRP